MRKKILIIYFLSLFLSTSEISFADTLIKNLSFSEICGVDFMMETQMGKIDARFSVCRLMSDFGPDTKLYFLMRYDKEWPSFVDKMIEHSHSPVIRKIDDTIYFLYTNGANSTCVTSYTLKSGKPVFVSTKTIAWNDGGYFKKSEDFNEYSELLKSRQ